MYYPATTSLRMHSRLNAVEVEETSTELDGAQLALVVSSRHEATSPMLEYMNRQRKENDIWAGDILDRKPFLVSVNMGTLRTARGSCGYSFTSWWFQDLGTQMTHHD